MNAITSIADQVNDLYGYVQERFLWQFYSRTWDRTENINGITAQGTLMLLGQPFLSETPEQRLQAVDAKVMVNDFQERFPWLAEAEPEQIRQLMSGLRDRLLDIAITRSKNRELNHSLY